MYTDPTGYSISFLFILAGIAIGATVGFLGTMYSDYVDDGEVFNGSVDTESYVSNTVVGGIVGGGVSYAAPIIGTFLSTSFTLSTPIVAGGEAIAISVSGVQIAGVATAGTMLFASNNRPKDNKKQNQQFKDAMRELNITNRDKMRRVHDHIKGRNMGYNELLEFIKEVLRLK